MSLKGSYLLSERHEIYILQNDNQERKFFPTKMSEITSNYRQNDQHPMTEDCILKDFK